MMRQLVLREDNIRQGRGQLSGPEAVGESGVPRCRSVERCSAHRGSVLTASSALVKSSLKKDLMSVMYTEVKIKAVEAISLNVALMNSGLICERWSTLINQRPQCNSCLIQRKSGLGTSEKIS